MTNPSLVLTALLFGTMGLSACGSTSTASPNDGTVDGGGALDGSPDGADGPGPGTTGGTTAGTTCIGTACGEVRGRTKAGILVGGIASDGTDIFWSTVRPSGPSESGIQRAPVQGGDAQAVVLAFRYVGSFFGAGSSVVFAGAREDGTLEQGLWRVKRDGTALERIADGAFVLVGADDTAAWALKDGASFETVATSSTPVTFSSLGAVTTPGATYFVDAGAVVELTKAGARSELGKALSLNLVGDAQGLVYARSTAGGFELVRYGLPSRAVTVLLTGDGRIGRIARRNTDGRIFALHERPSDPQGPTELLAITEGEATAQVLAEDVRFGSALATDAEAVYFSRIEADGTTSVVRLRR